MALYTVIQISNEISYYKVDFFPFFKNIILLVYSYIEVSQYLNISFVFLNDLAINNTAYHFSTFLDDTEYILNCRMTPLIVDCWTSYSRTVLSVILCIIGWPFLVPNQPLNECIEFILDVK